MIYHKIGPLSENIEYKNKLQKCYLNNLKKIKTLDENYDLINKVKKNFKEKKVKCIKYNHSLLFEY